MDELNEANNAEEKAGYEKKDVNIKIVVSIIVTVSLALILVVVFLYDYFVSTHEEYVYEAVLKPESTELRELHARETEELNTYKVLDAGKGIYRIPIDRAMKLMAEEAFESDKNKGGTK